MNDARKLLHTLNEDYPRATLKQMSADIRTMRAQLLDQKRVTEGPENDYLAEAINGLSDATGALNELLDWREDQKRSK